MPEQDDTITDAPTVLILRLGAMGDILFTTPVLRAIKAEFPKSHVTYVLLKKWEFLLCNNPTIDRVVGLKHTEPKALGRLTEETFDFIINLYEYEVGARLCQLIPARQRRGHQWRHGEMQIDNFGRLLVKNREARLSQYHQGIIYPEIYCSIAGVQPDSYHLDYYPGKIAAWRARFFLHQNGLSQGSPPIAMHLHSRGMETKCWNPQQALEVTRAVPERQFVILGYEPDREITRIFEPEVNATVSLAPIPVQAEIIRRCALFVGIDSGPRQVASAMGTPALTLFGPNPARFIPAFDNDRALSVNWSCAPCFESACQHNRQCLDQISPKRIASTIREMLE